MKEGKAYIGDEIVEGNKLIGVFDGWTFVDENTVTRPDHADHGQLIELRKDILRYHEDWNQLMPVVEKIRGLWNEESLDLQLLEEDDDASKIKHLRVWSEIYSVWQAVVQFIKWYHQNKQS